MPDRCVIKCCSNMPKRGEVAMFKWPVGSEVLSCKWMIFLRTTRKDVFVPTKSSSVCHHHFEASCVEGWMKWRHGIGRLSLREGAVPSIRSKRHAGVFYAVFIVCFGSNLEYSLHDLAYAKANK